MSKTRNTQGCCNVVMKGCCDPIPTPLLLAPSLAPPTFLLPSIPAQLPIGEGLVFFSSLTPIPV